MSFIIVLSIIAVYTGPKKVKNPYAYVKDSIKKDVSKCTNVENDYYYVRDGYAFMSFDCSDTDIYDQVRNWKELPLTENLDQMLYISLRLDKEYNFDKPTNGYYYFIDRYTKQYKDNDDIYSDTLLFERYSTNFTVAIYDNDNKMFYYYELDT